mmetsp:Transcript_90068/g.234786  ORF Transcript_90068/g.234786 Transcript_90068/m.234786 type:complete len:261 (-) Transcript_90068:252-1034(-)
MENFRNGSRRQVWRDSDRHSSRRFQWALGAQVQPRRFLGGSLVQRELPKQLPAAGTSQGTLAGCSEEAGSAGAGPAGPGRLGRCDVEDGDGGYRRRPATHEPGKHGRLEPGAGWRCDRGAFHAAGALQEGLIRAAPHFSRDHYSWCGIPAGRGYNSCASWSTARRGLASSGGRGTEARKGGLDFARGVDATRLRVQALRQKPRWFCPGHHPEGHRPVWLHGGAGREVKRTRRCGWWIGASWEHGVHACGCRAKSTGAAFG